MNDNSESQQINPANNDQQAPASEPIESAPRPAANEQPQPPVDGPVDITDATPVVTVPTPQTVAPQQQTDVKPQTMYFGHTVPEIRALLFKGLLGCLITAAAIAVIAILIGGMGDIAWRAIGTIFIAILHISFLFLILPAGHASGSARRSSNMLINVLLFIVAFSFFTAVAHQWTFITSEIAAKLYSTYVVAFISLLHAKALMDIEDTDPSVRTVIRYNYGALGLAAALVAGLIYIENSYNLLSGFYGRLLAATFIVDVTLSIVVAVMHRLYTQKHPELTMEENTGKHSAGRVALIVIGSVVGFFILMALVAAMRWLR